MTRIQLIDAPLIDAVTERARKSPRLRTNHNFHRDHADNPHRFLNALTRGTYCAPHRHLEPPKSETFLVLRGEVVVFLFDDRGRVSARHLLGRAGLFGIDIAPGAWHSIAAQSDSAVCFEVKPGPYEASADKEFAPWAPREGDARASAYLAELLAGTHEPFGPR
jgi:cupin fold WbuC family metalloprotein